MDWCSDCTVVEFIIIIIKSKHATLKDEMAQLLYVPNIAVNV